MDGCKLIIEYEVDCTFEFPDEDNDKSVIAVLDKEIKTSKGKIRPTSPNIYEYTAYYFFANSILYLSNYRFFDNFMR